jgi:hypothetical protein
MDVWTSRAKYDKTVLRSSGLSCRGSNGKNLAFGRRLSRTKFGQRGIIQSLSSILIFEPRANNR